MILVFSFLLLLKPVSNLEGWGEKYFLLYVRIYFGVNSKHFGLFLLNENIDSFLFKNALISTSFKYLKSYEYVIV